MASTPKPNPHIPPGKVHPPAQPKKTIPPPAPTRRPR